MLIAGIWLRISGTVVSLLLLTFFGLMVRAYAKGMEISCGCFGPGEVISWKTLLRDGAICRRRARDDLARIYEPFQDRGLTHMKEAA